MALVAVILEVKEFNRNVFMRPWHKLCGDKTCVVTSHSSGAANRNMVFSWSLEKNNENDAWAFHTCSDSPKAESWGGGGGWEVGNISLILAGLV